jgi:hypothetical protein
LAAQRRQFGQSRTNGAPKAAKLPWLDHESEPIVNDRWVTVSSLRRSAVADVGFNHEMSRRIGAIRRRGFDVSNNISALACRHGDLRR